MPYLVSHVPDDPDHDFRDGARVRHAAGPVNVYVEAVTLQERLSAYLDIHAGEGVFPGNTGGSLCARRPPNSLVEPVTRKG